MKFTTMREFYLFTLEFIIFVLALNIFCALLYFYYVFLPIIYIYILIHWTFSKKEMGNTLSSSNRSTIFINIQIHSQVLIAHSIRSWGNTFYGYNRLVDRKPLEIRRLDPWTFSRHIAGHPVRRLKENLK